MKYYYKAQKDFEKRTGKPAYRQVSPSTTFAEYFERQDDAFKRSWLGAKRYKAYRNGATFGDVVKPAASYRATTDDLTPPTEKPKETAASDDKQGNASATPPANEVLAPWEGPDELARLREKQRLDPATLPTLDGSPKQVAWVRDRIRADQVDAFNAVDFPEYLKTRIGGATDDEEEAARLALVRAEIAKRGEAAVLTELEEAAQEIAAKMFAEPSCRAWIDGRFGPGVLHRSTTEALRRVATTGSAAKPKPAFDLPPLDLPELVLPRLEGTPRQQSWAEDLRRRAVRDLTEERANETARDALRRYRDKESAFAEEFRSDLEAAIKAVGGDEAAELILGREIFLDARGHVENFDRARDWINLHVADKKTLLEAAEFHVAGNPQNVAEILRRYAADAKAQAPQSEGETFGLAVGKDRKEKTSFLGRWLRAASNNDGDDLPEYNPQEWQDEERYLAETKAEIAAFRKTATAQDFKGVADFLHKKYNIDVSGLDKAPEIATIYTDGILDVMERFGDVGTLRRVKVVDSLSGGRIAQFTPETGEIEILRQTRQQLATTVKKEFEAGNWCSGDLRAVARHEMGHVVSAYLKSETFEKSVRPRFLRGLDSIKKEARKLPPEKWKSDYSFEKNEEFFAELIAAYFDGSLPQERQKQATEYITRLLNLTPLRG